MIGVSSKGLALIKGFEGFSAVAYRCPANVPTIGYGTTRYPDGRAVKDFDEVSEEKAEAFLLDECNAIAREMAKLIKVPLNQNQADALISFCYNLGCGAFAESTLLKKLNDGDYQGAANEFSRWNKAVVNGVKQEVAGLTRRRAEEKALFETVGSEESPLDATPSPQDKVTWLEIYRADDGNSIVAAWAGEELVELIGFDRALKEDLAAVLKQYKNAKNVHVAPADKAIPVCDVIKIDGADKEVPPTIKPQPALGDKLLLRGSKGELVVWLQERLGELGYYRGEIDGDFGHGTDDAVRRFQTAIFGSAGADGKVGPKTWQSLAGQAPQLKTEPMPAGTYLRLTKTNSKDCHGCFELRLAYIKNGKEVDAMMVCSGQPNKQLFRIGRESKAGSYEPLPEGKWGMRNIEWKAGKDNYSLTNSWAAGVGPVRIWLDYKGPGTTERSAILIHLDSNRPPHGRCPGTAGCIGIYNVADFKRLVTWLRDTDPRDLYVDWGLGTCPKPASAQQTVTA
ncbi:glycoside hydrolase family protein [Nodosilinea sp. PGN35]|uniref:glycoside hydrolase family protein n=1 Tax=Nodosilinea sp. PGN35 TaxID=3020489 RepID=UPI0023B30DCD|nr:glycoside hydrolase family protein [Nodosilinea sp. TSF1-S3]MDF0366565.1 glycoside hydrolase family protein [Nodosilinea sp. TSF1-S3]